MVVKVMGEPAVAKGSNKTDFGAEWRLASVDIMLQQFSNGILSHGSSVCSLYIYTQPQP
jgi:hypothetical protein